MPSSQPKHTYPVELYYVILAISVLLTAFILYNLLINKNNKPATVLTPNNVERELTAVEKFEISQNFSQNKANLSTSQKARISGTYTQKSTTTTLSDEEKAEIMKSYSR